MAFPSDKVPGYDKLPMSIIKDTLSCNFPIVMDIVYRRLLTPVSDGLEDLRNYPIT